MEQSQKEKEKMTNSSIRKRKREDQPSSSKKSLEINKKPHLISTERVRAFRQRQRERQMKENDTVISSIQNGHQHDNSEQLNIIPSTDFVIIHKKSTERVRAFRQRQRENQRKKNSTVISSIQNDRQHDNFEQSNIIPSTSTNSAIVRKKPALTSTERSRAFRQRQRKRQMKENATVISSIQNSYQHDNSEQSNIIPRTITDFAIFHKKPLPASTERVRAFRQRQRENQRKKNSTVISSIQNDRQHDNFEQSNIIPSTSTNSAIVRKKPALTSTERSRALRQRQRKRQMKENATVISSIQNSYQHDNSEQSNIIPRTSTDFVIFHKKPLPTSTERVRAFRQRQREKQPHSAMMEDGAGIHVKEMTIKTEVEEAAPSIGHVDIEIDTNHIKEEPGLVQLVKNEPALLVKEEILEDSRQDGHEQRCVQGALSSAIIGSVNDACSMCFGEVRNIKDELTDIDIGPTVLQHVDIHYRINKNTSVTEQNIIVDDCNEPMPCNRVKKECVEDKLSVKNAKNLWKQLRDGHRQAMARTKTTTRPASSSSAKWIYEQRMKFLLPYRTNRKANMPQEQGNQQNDGTIDTQEHDNDDDDVTDSPRNKWRDNKISALLENEQKRREKSCMERDLLKKQIPDNSGNILSSQKAALETFFYSMCETTNSLPDHLQIRVQRNIFNVVMEAREENLTSQTIHPVSGSSASNVYNIRGDNYTSLPTSVSSNYSYSISKLSPSTPVQSATVQEQYIPPSYSFITSPESQGQVVSPDGEAPSNRKENICSYIEHVNFGAT